MDTALPPLVGALAPQAARRPSTRRWVTVAGATYVGSWLAGLAVAPAGPAGDATAAQVHARYAEAAGAVLTQSLLVHGLAGVALAGLALALPRALGSPARLRRLVAGLGAGAAAVSLLQAGLGARAATGVEGADPATSLALFQAVSTADSVKLLLLAGFVGAATLALARAGALRPWLRGTAVVLVPLLPLSGASFLVDSPALTALLFVSLPLLLVWAGGAARAASRPAPGRSGHGSGGTLDANGGMPTP